MPDEDEIEEKTVELPEGWSESDFINEDEPAVEAELAPETPETPAETPETPETPPAPRVPPLFADVTDPAERKALIEDAIAALAPEDRVSLKGVDEIVRGAHALGETAGERKTREQIENDSTEQQRIDAAETFVERAKQYGASPEFKWDDELANVEKYAADARQNEFVGHMSRGIGNAFKNVGVTSFPSELIDRVNAAQNFDQVIGEYVQYAIAVGVDGGKALQSQAHAATAEADAIAARARQKQEALGALAKEGRIRIGRDEEGFYATLVSDTAPIINGTPASGSAEITEAEFELAQRDPDAEARILNDPAKGPAYERMWAEALAGARR